MKTFFYHSRRSTEAGIAGISDIIRTARRFNAEHGITGVLVFDGERFCQAIEGPPEQIDELVLRLEADARHVAFTPLLNRADTAERRFPRWSMAYSTLDGSDYLDDLLGLAPEHALDQLKHTIDRLDVA